MNPLLPFFNAFQQAVRTLEQRCGGEPARLGILVPNDEEARKTTGWLYFEANRYEELKSQRRFTSAPGWFIDLYASYVSRWKTRVDKAYGGLTVDLMFSETDTVNGLSWEQIYQPMPSFLENYARPYREFFPSLKAGATAIQAVMDNAYDTYGLDDPDEAADGNNLRWMLEGVEAWDFFRKEIKIDFDGIETRWKELPRATIPSHINGGRSRDADSLVKLLDDAVLAYLVGANGAAVATCRAILEHLLKTFYVPHRIDETQKDVKLADLINWAECELGFAWIVRLPLGRLRRFANDILHEPGAVHWIARSSEIVDFLRAIAVLIERAPSPNKPR